MAYRLDPSQRSLLAQILTEGRSVIRDPKLRRIADRAAAQTAIVESGIRNLSGGDADSAGWRQERASLYKNPTNVKAAARRFYREFAQHYDPGEHSWEVAAQVQRPRADLRGRYRQEARAAAQALRQVGAITDTGGSSGVQTGSSSPVQGPQMDAGGGTGLAELLSSMVGQQRGPVSSGVPAPAQNPYLRFAGQSPQTQGVQPPDSGVGEQLGALSSLLGPGLQQLPENVADTTTGGGRGGARGQLDGDAYPIRGGGGKLIGTPHSGTHTLGNWQSDNAVDIRVPNNTVLEALDDGVVEKVKGSYSGGRSRFDGYQVTIRFKDGNRAFYTHLSRTHLKPGQRVRKGQAVGRSGSANGVPHLHLGVEHGDPRKLIGRGR